MQDVPPIPQRKQPRPTKGRIDPVLVLDSRERYAPVAVEAILEVPGVEVIDPAGKKSPLRSFADLPAQGGRINLPPNPERWAPAIQMKHGLVGYIRTVKAGGLIWFQYWTYWFHNPKRYVGYGEHESDFEFVQLGCVDLLGRIPVLATGSQHHTGGKREVWRMIRRQERPVFYVARDSHANYFTPTSDIEDQANGKGEVLEQIEWRPFGSWASWPGKWGNSDNSPDSPGRQGTRWNAPHLYHGQAR